MRVDKVNIQADPFISRKDYATLKETFKEFSKTREYAALTALYESSLASLTVSDELQVISLLRENIEALATRKTSPLPAAIETVRSELQDTAARLSATLDILGGTARPVPKIMHFVWVGGSQVGANQRDYMNIWRQVLEPQGYRFNLWYDSDALLAFEMNRVIHDSARAHAMESGGDKVTKASRLSQMIEDRARVLKQQMFAYLAQPRWQGKEDAARIDLMVRAYGKDRATLDALLKQCMLTHEAMVGSDLQLRDVRHEFSGHFLRDVYQREVAMRGNFAAASDVVRLQAEHLEGGRYSDMDYLPPLAEKPGGVDISQYDDQQRLGLLQLFLNHDEALMPGRDRLRYADSTETLPAGDKTALLAFAESRPGIERIFTAPVDFFSSAHGLRMGTQIGREMNAHMLAQPQSGMTLAVMQLIRFNYDFLYSVESRAMASGIDWSQPSRLLDVIENAWREKFGDAQLTHTFRDFLGKLSEAVNGYYSDGIRVAARGTINLTGPGAAITGVKNYIETHLLQRDQNAIQEHLKLAEGYNFHTEEETISGWTVNDDEDLWLAREQDKWRTGKLKSRYAGELNDLLKPQTLTFKQGWPVIEGKPVLLTSVLQQLMDDLGEPFIQAMRDKSDDIALDKAFTIDFDSRQRIIAQPETQLPTCLGADSAGHLNELFSRIAHGSLLLEQLSPSTRVMLGGIFGATSLDDAGFADTWQNVRKLAIETDNDGTFARYDAIEKAVRQRLSLVSESGPARHLPSSTQTARELKVRALAEPLTLRQWGERIEQINRTAQLEFRTQILQRSGQVRNAFFKAGAVSARQLPQDLLMRNAGEPGRRCYPLALLMGAALAAGETAERALVGHVATANASPEDVSSRALLSALDELRALPSRDVGTARGAHDFDGALRVLDASAVPAVLLLDTGDHALLLAKVQVAEQTVYRFYDPNFALYGFADGEHMKQGVEHYLSAGDNALARLYGLGDMATARFNVVELDTAMIAARMLSSDLRVDGFWHKAAGADHHVAAIWAKQAVARSRSLTENARMGAGLAQLDARFWAGELEQASQRLRSEHKLGREYSPVLDSLSDSADDGYRMTLVDSRHPQRTVEVITQDSRFAKVKKYVDQLVRAGAGKPGPAAESDGGSRLSFAFAIQTLISEMRRRDYQADEQLPGLTIALQVQVYVSYAQLGFGVVSDVVQIARLVRQVAASEQAIRQASLSGRLAGQAATGLGIAFSVANIGFDIYNLSLAENAEQRSRFSTSLAFNVAALGLDLVALTVGGGVGVVAAALSVPLLGIGIGVTAIASNLGQIMDKAAAVGMHLSELHDAYQKTYEAKAGVLQFPPMAVITEVNLQSRRIGFEGQKFYPWTGSDLELPQYDDDPRNRHKSINIPRAFERPAAASVWGSLPETVVLPCSPICHYGYEYQLGSAGAVPFSTTRYPQLHDRLAHGLEYDADGNRTFYLFSTPFLPHILFKLHPVYTATSVKVQLTVQVRQLVVPDLPQAWKKKISYRITAPQGQYQIRLAPGLLAVNFEQAKGWEKVVWTVHAAWADFAQVSFRESIDSAPEMLVDGITLNKFDGVIELAEGLFRIDWSSRSLHLVAITLDYEKDAGAQSSAIPSRVLSYLRKEVKDKQLTAAFVPLRKFRVPFSSGSEPVFTTGYYDTARDRVLYARNVPHEVNDGLILGGVSARHAWFYHPDHATLWRVDILTGSVMHRYRLKNPRIGSTIIECRQQSDGSLHVLQRLADEQSFGVTTIEYRITDQTVELTRCRITFSAEDYRFQPDETLRQIDIPFQDDTPAMAAGISEFAFAPFIVVEGYAGLRLQDRAWINKKTGKRCQAAQNLSWPEDLLLLMPPAADNNAVLFYSQQEQTISRGIEPSIGHFENIVIERDVVDVTQTDKQCIATKSDGRLYEVAIIDVPPLTNRSDEQWRNQKDKPGILGFAGLGEHWLRQNPDWLSALPVQAKDSKGLPFPIIGLRGLAGHALLAAWCVDEKVVLTDIGPGKELALLGLTPDKQAVWLLDVAAGQLYRQPLIELDTLRGAFASGHRLISPEPLASTEKVWSQWAFAQVHRQGEALVGQTREGVNMLLEDRQPAKIMGVENRWSYLYGQTEEQLRTRLKTLLSGQAHAPVLHVESLPNRYKYYLPELDRLFDLSGRSDGQWAVFLGTREASQPLLFDPVDQLIFSAGPINGVWLPASYASRDEEVMALEVRDDMTDISALLPDGVARLLLTYGPQTSGYRVSQEAWQRLDCIVVDVRRSFDTEAAEPWLLDLDVDECGHWLMSQVAADVVLSDSDTGRSLVVRNFNEQCLLELTVGIASGKSTFALAAGLHAFARVRDGESIVSLAAVIEALR